MKLFLSLLAVLPQVFTLMPRAFADDAPTVDHTYFYRGGLFSQLADCQAVLPAQAKLFQEQTGLTPLATSCVEGRSSEPGHRLFTPLIDSTGTPKKYLYPVDTFTKLGMLNSPQAMAILHTLIQKSATIALETSDEIVYYADGPLDIANIDISFYTRATECTSQLDTLRSVYHQGGISTMIGECITDEFSQTTRMAVDWVGDNTAVFEDHAMKSAVYPTFQSCMDAIGDAVAARKTSLPSDKHVYGAVCETHENADAANDGYAIDIFSDNI